jgi:hypothetical protein
MAQADLSVGECVLRALIASEIADSCPDPSLRRSFFELTSTWLVRAGEIGGYQESSGAPE